MKVLNLPILRQLHEMAQQRRCRARWLDLHLAQTLVERSQLRGPAAERLALATALLSYQLGRGEVCLDLRRLPDEPFAVADVGPLRQALAQLTIANLQGLPGVGVPGELAPLVLDGSRLYLHKYWRYEQQVRDALEWRARQPSRPLLPAQRRLFQQLFPVSNRPVGSAVVPPAVEAEAELAVDWQAVAVALALLRPLAVITGGPGTGKTQVVTQLLALLMTAAPEASTLPVIKLVAPTGKAAGRLSESIGGAKQRLPIPLELAAQIPEQAQTLHRLLGAGSKPGSFKHNRDNPLHLDVLVLDEASMVDLPLMAQLMAALPLQARLVILGDADQLASVEAGSVLADLVPDAQPSGYSPDIRHTIAELTGAWVPAWPGGLNEAPPLLQDSICRLQRSYRFSADLAGVASAINRQDEQALDAALQASAQVEWRPLQRDSMTDLVQAAKAGFQPYRALVRAGAPPETVLRAFEQYRVLAAVREGPQGVVVLNQAIEAALFGRTLSPGSGSFYAGQPLLMTRNDYALELFNGDVGLVLACPQRQELRAYFVQSGGLRDVALSRLPPHETAFAMTIHKSQGSEFDRVLVVLPEQDSEILTKELLYTAITRARRGCTLAAEPSVLRAALMRRTQRASGLGPALWRTDGSKHDGGHV